MDMLAQLISQAHALIEQADGSFPVQVFHCREKQQLHRVHFFQPTLMLVLRGAKQISGPSPTQCPEGNMLLVSSGYEFPFANIPNDFYMALVIPFSPEDFPNKTTNDEAPSIEIQQAPDAILTLIQQLMNLSNSALPGNVLESRRKELATLLSHLQLDANLRCPATPTWRTKVVDLLQTDIAKEWKLEEVCQTLATSESNLRRRLQQENTGFRELLEDLRLTYGLGLIQTSHFPINQIALECGYQSASRFSERFKKRFHTTPSELRQAL
jgi:AraC-like DNA-binding protein